MQHPLTALRLWCGLLIAFGCLTSKSASAQGLTLSESATKQEPFLVAQQTDASAPATASTIVQSVVAQSGSPQNSLPSAPQPPREPLPPSTQPPTVSPPEPLPPTEPLLPPPPASAPSEPFDKTPATITIERVDILGSTVFSAATFAKITEPFTKRPLTIADLFQLRSAIAQLYLDNGYITSGAYIPPQVLQRGVVTIQVVEGKLETITVTGTRRLKPNYVRSRLALATGQPLNRNRLLEALQMLQLDPLIQSLSAELSAGIRPGESVLSVRVIEAPPLNAQLTFDNGRAPSIGTDRRQLQASLGNVTGFGDRLSAVYTNTDGSNAVDLSYVFPFNPQNGTLSFNYGSASSNVIEAPFARLGIASQSRYYELTLRQPIIQSPTHELALGITATRRESEATLADGLLPFPALGADRNGKTRLTALRFFQEMTWRSSSEVIALRSQFTVGLNALNATLNAEPPDSRFFAWRGQAQWVRLLATDTLLLLRGDLQLADRPLLSLEQFGLGGQDSVRGYRQDALLTDSGLFASAEVRLPILRLPKLKSLLQLIPFLDLGTAWNQGNILDPDPRTLLAAGLGLRLQVNDRLTARLDWGIPLISISGPRTLARKWGLLFNCCKSILTKKRQEAEEKWIESRRQEAESRRSTPAKAIDA